jgi:tubulin gamma
VEQFKQIYKKQAFIKTYQDFPMFKEDLSEMDDSQQVVQSLIDEYIAAEKEGSSYTEWGNNMEL